MNIVTIPIERCDDRAKYPEYAHENDGAMDIYALEDVIIGHNETKIIKTGLKVAIPDGYAILIQPRSGLSAKTSLRIPNSPGLIDAGYRDEIGVIVENIADHGQHTINAGDRIAQMRLVEVPKIEWQPVLDVSSIGDNRDGGFGSTGV